MLPLSSFNLQEVALAKEDARIRGRRERDEARRDRFMNARTRIMGVDAQALDQQVADMRRGRTDAKETDRIENLRMIQIQNLLEQAHQEEKYMRKQQTEELKHSWMSEIAARKANQPEPYVLKLDECGASSAQNFGGDDAKRDEKARIQKEQMRTWVKDALLEQKYKQVSDKEEDLRYAALMQALDHYREAAEDEEKQMNHIVKIAVKEENTALAAEARIRNGKVIDPANMPTSLDLFNEDLYMAMDEQGRIIRRDHFKGFTPAQLRRLMQENEMILQEKRDKATGDRNGDKAWTRQQMMIERAMEEANEEEKALREQEKIHHLSVLRAQAEEKARNIAAYKAAQREMPQGMKSGGGGFYDGFGRSCR